MAYLRITFALGLGLFLIGCRSDDRVAAVTGVVTLDDKPIAEASVTFMPKEGGRPAFGVTDASGKYELTTFEEGDGALIGNHIVTILAVDEKVSDKAVAAAEEHGSLSEFMQPQAKQKWIVPERYSEQDTSGLSFDVRRGEQNRADFPLTKKP